MKGSVRDEFEGHFFLTIPQVCKLYNFSPKTLKRREKDGAIPIPPRIEKPNKLVGLNSVFSSLSQIFFSSSAIYAYPCSWWMSFSISKEIFPKNYICIFL